MKGGLKIMSKRVKASAMTQEATTACRGSEKKNKTLKPWYVIGCIMTVGFIAVAAHQGIKACNNIKSANIVYANNVQQMKIQQAEQEHQRQQLQQAEQERLNAQKALENDLNVSIDNGTVTSNDNSKNMDESYYVNSKGDVVQVDKKKHTTNVYYICTTCTKCGHISRGCKICKKCGSNLKRYTVYKVKKGDTLSHVSGKVGSSVDSIAKLNKLKNVNLIYTGESLRIPK